jgi:hypothetical protein
MISEITKQMNNTGLVFEFISNTAGCSSLDLQLSYNGALISDGDWNNNPFIYFLKGSKSLVAVGGSDASGNRG